RYPHLERFGFPYETRSAASLAGAPLPARSATLWARHGESHRACLACGLSRSAASRAGDGSASRRSRSFAGRAGLLARDGYPHLRSTNGVPEPKVHLMFEVASLLGALSFFLFVPARAIEQLRENVPNASAEASALFGLCIDVVEVRKIKAREIDS